MERITVFLDTYALIEILKENPNYYRIVSLRGVFTLFNVIEVYYHVLADYGERKARELYNHLKENIIEIDDLAIFEAMKFRLEHKKLDVSYADAIGYVCARNNGLPFVTGDKAFEHLDNVIFIKK